MIAISFQFNLTHPHDSLIKLSKTLKISKETAKTAWDTLNNWYETEDFVLWEAAHTLALSALKRCIGNGGLELENLMKFVKNNSFKLIN